MDTIQLTYKEIADRLGTQVDSARKLVRRRRWQKAKGNDGQLRISVPSDYFVSQDGAQSPSSSDDQDMSQRADQVYVRELETRIEGLKMLLQAETRRADEAIVDRDRWHQLAVRPWWKRLAG